MKKSFLIFGFLFSTSVFGQTPFKDFLARVNQLSNPPEKSAVIDSFFNHTRFPYIEIDPASPTGYTAYFIYRGAMVISPS